MDIRTEQLTIAVGRHSMAGYLARPADQAPRAAVIVFMEIFGINAHIRDVVERIAREGYVALAPDYFHRFSPGIQRAYDAEGTAAGLRSLAKLEVDAMIADARATIAALRARDDVLSEKMGAIGFCVGGHMAYLAACETELVATASFYGAGITAPTTFGGGAATIARTSKAVGRILCLLGDQDHLIPEAEVAAIRSALSTASGHHEVVVYANAGHGFFCDQRGSFEPRAAADAWLRVKAFFRSALGPSA